MKQWLGYLACLKYLTYPKIPLIYVLALVAVGYGLWRETPWQEPAMDEVSVAVQHWLDMEIEVPQEELFQADLPDFSVYGDVAERKAAFFSFIYEFIEHENARILALREQLEPIWQVVEDDPAALSDRLRDRLVRIAGQYRLDAEAMDEEEMARELALRVDIIPPSLVLAQAANESAWGTSRFAREANNLFGQWCFTEGCGLVPQRRIPGATHEVRRFDSVADAVHAYYRNINTNLTYEYLRELRYEMRKKGQEPLDSLALVYGLTRYSERGSEYITELQSMIRFNRLITLDEQHLQLLQS